MNNAKYRNGNFKPKSKLWFDNLHKQLLQYGEQLFSLGDQYCPSKEYYTIDITYFIDNLMVKDGSKLHSRNYDLSNIEKYIIDVLFGDKVAKHTTNINQDDAYILDLTSKKRHTSGEPYIEVEISRCSLDSLE